MDNDQTLKCPFPGVPGCGNTDADLFQILEAECPDCGQAMYIVYCEKCSQTFVRTAQGVSLTREPEEA